VPCVAEARKAVEGDSRASGTLRAAGVAQSNAGHALAASELSFFITNARQLPCRLVLHTLDTVSSCSMVDGACRSIDQIAFPTVASRIRRTSRDKLGITKPLSHRSICLPICRAASSIHVACKGPRLAGQTRPRCR
jgi:hypothetical protein